MIVVITLNMVFRIIIDAFAELRDEKQSRRTKNGLPYLWAVCKLLRPLCGRRVQCACTAVPQDVAMLVFHGASGPKMQ